MEKTRHLQTDSTLFRYGFAVLIVVFVTLLRKPLNPLIGVSAVPFILYFPAIMMSGWYGRLGPGLLATALSGLGALYFNIEPTFDFTLFDSSEVFRLSLFLIEGVFISFLAEAWHRSKEALVVSKDAEIEQREWLQVILSSIGDAVMVADYDARVSFLNPVAQSLTGWEQEEAKGKPFDVVFNIVNEETLARVESPVTKVLREGTIVGLANHTILIRKDGSEIPIDDSGAPIKNHAGNIIGVVLVFRDITERKRTDEAVRKWEQVFEQANWGVVIANPADNTLQAVNSAYADMHGYSVDELIGMPISCTMAPEARSLWPEKVRVTHESGHHVYESLHIRKDGTSFPVLMDVTAVKDEDGRVIYRAANLQDITERKQAEEQIAFAASIVESSDDAIIGKTLDGIIVSWNAGAESIYGYTAAEVKGQHISIIAPDEGRQEIAMILERLRRGEPIHHYETSRVAKDGARVDVALSISPIKDTGGKIIGASTIARNITERKRAEAERAILLSEIENQRKRLNNIVANVPGIVWEAWGQPDEASQQIDFVSDYVEKMLGYSVDEWLSTPNFWLSIVYEDDRTRAAQEASAIYASCKGGTSEFRWVTKDGRQIWVESQSVVACDEAGNPIGMRGVTMDISERKRSEEAQEFLARASSVLASSLDYEATLASVARLTVPHLADWCGVDIVDEDGRIRQLAVAHVDPAKVEMARDFSRRFPLDPNAQVGSANVLRTGKPEFYPDITDEVLLAAARDEEHFNLIRNLGFKSAMILPLVARGRTHGLITLVIAESGRHYDKTDLALAEDLAQRAAFAVDNARLYREAQRARAEAEHANRAKDEFLATVSHELRTPLNAIIGWAHMLRHNKFDEATTERAMETIERNSRAQARLIEDILDVSRIITGKLRLDVQPIELIPVVEAAIDAVRPAADAKEIRLQTILDPRAGPISGDPGRLQQVVWNLMSNAVKFTSRGGRIQIRLERVNSHVEIIVSDTGQGISAELLPYIFERFRQGDSSSTRIHGGLGLGLAIVRHLVELHGGTVHASSMGDGEGATFTVKLPLLVWHRDFKEGQRTHPASSSDPASGQAPSLNGLRVLVVDDEPDTREMLKLMIEQFGAEVKLSASTAEALNALEQWKPNVLVSDIEMPGEDGYTFIKKVRALEPERGGTIAAIALTAYARAEDRIRALAAGYHMHMSKPAEPVELAIVIANLSGRNGQGLAR
jgi:PAS domain S-box-containing protein